MIDRASYHGQRRELAFHQRPLRHWTAFTLVEVTLALGVIAFCTVALIGMVPVGLQSERSSYDQMQATHLLNEIQKDFSSIAKPYSDPSNPSATTPTPGQLLTTTLRFDIPLPSPSTPVSPPNNNFGVFHVDDSFLLCPETPAGVLLAHYAVHYDLTHYNVNSPGAAPLNVPYQVRVLVAWPSTAAFVGSGTGLTLTGAHGYVETVMTINRL